MSLYQIIAFNNLHVQSFNEQTHFRMVEPLHYLPFKIVIKNWWINSTFLWEHFQQGDLKETNQLFTFWFMIFIHNKN